jgi:Raf kinase inhibitor-like YbhB/YbcL family protein
MARQPKEDPRMSFRLTSKSLKDGGTLPEAHVFNGMGYTGGNVSPHLAWEDAPAGTKSFVVTAYDPDAPTGSGWWHWVVVNLPAATKELAEGAGSAKGKLPKGALQTRTDFGMPGYGGAAPPPGPAHRYIFTVHALKVERLDVDENASAALVGFMTHANSLGKATLTVTYGK